MTNDDELAEQDPADADDGDDASLAWRSIAPQLQEFAVRQHELTDLAAQVGRFGQLTSLQSVFDAVDRYQELAKKMMGHFVARCPG